MHQATIHPRRQNTLKLSGGPLRYIFPESDDEDENEHEPGSEVKNEHKEQATIEHPSLPPPLRHAPPPPILTQSKFESRYLRFEAANKPENATRRKPSTPKQPTRQASISPTVPPTPLLPSSPALASPIFPEPQSSFSDDNSSDHEERTGRSQSSVRRRLLKVRSLPIVRPSTSMPESVPPRSPTSPDRSLRRSQSVELGEETGGDTGQAMGSKGRGRRLWSKVKAKFSRRQPSS